MLINARCYPVPTTLSPCPPRPYDVGTSYDNAVPTALVLRQSRFNYIREVKISLRQRQRVRERQLNIAVVFVTFL